MSDNTAPILYDPRGNIIPSAMGLYSDPYINSAEFRPRYYSLQDTEKSVNQYEREKIVRLSHDIIGKSAMLQQAINQKADWAFGSNWVPSYVGEDSDWATKYAEPFAQRWVKQMSTKGWDINTVGKNISYEIDRSGDVLMVLTENQYGYPLVQFICSHRIGNRNYSDLVKSGTYKGYKIQDGIILDDFGLPRAYYILGDNEAEDRQVNVQSAYLICEPRHMDKFRGIAPLANALKDGVDVEDIDHYLKLMVKLESSIGILHSNESGVAPAGSYNPLKDSRGKVLQPSTTAANETPLKPMNGGSIMYFQVGKGKLDSFNTNRPAETTVNFVRRVEHRLVGSLWVYEILNPNESGGASARGVAEQGRKIIETRQNVVEKALRIALLYAVSKAQQNKFIPTLKQGDTTSWSFSKPAKLTLDQGYEHQMRVELFKLGALPLEDLITFNGGNAKEVKAKVKKDNDYIIAQAQEYFKANGGTLEYWINFVSQRYANMPTGVTPPSTPSKE